MNLLKTLGATLLAATLSAPAFAQELTEAPAPGLYGSTFGGELTATASATSGNSETTDLGIFGRGGITLGLLTHELHGGYSYATDGDSTSKNKFYGGYQLNRSFGDGLFGLNDRWYGYALVRGSYDQLGAYRTDVFAGAGLGYTVVQDARTLWRLEAGPGARYFKAPGEDSNINLAFRAASRFDYALSDNVSFRNYTDAFFASEDTNIVNDTFLRFGVSANMDAEIGVRIDHHTNPPAGSEGTDTLTYAGITYRF